MKQIWILALLAAILTGCSQPADTNMAPDAGASGDTAATSASATSAEPAPKENTPVESSTEEAAAQVKDGEEVGVLETAKGTIIVRFFPDKAPKHVERFKMLAKKGFYDGTRFHRCIPGFMIQGGDPLTKDLSKSAMWGTGGYEENGVEKNVPAEFNARTHSRGILSAARSSDPNSASSQFFLMHQNTPQLDGQYSVYGQIIKGQNVVDEIVKTGDPNNNGAVVPSEAIVLKSVKIEKWPVK
jgi:peptidyl-prolyl cis-trans isomerase B (cyclophilin B)